MNKRQFHQESIRELLKLRRDLYTMEARAIKTAKRVRSCLKVGNREQAEAHRLSAVDMAMVVDFLRVQIGVINGDLAKVLAA